MGLTAPAVAAIARQFAMDGTITGAAPSPGGHINDSWRITVDRGPGGLLQRLNPRVFPRPGLVAENILRVTTHLTARLQAAGVGDWARRTLSIVPTRDGRAWLEEDGAWRMYRYIPGTVTRLTARGPADARQAGFAFGRFLALLADYAGPPLHETIPGFHDTRRRIEALERAVAADPAGRAGGVGRELAEVRRRRDLAGVIPGALARGEVPTRIVHNDAKIANLLFDEATGEPLAVVDLDTVMPGSALHDFGDLVRSTASPAAEDERDTASIRADRETCDALREGWLEGAGAVLTPRERELLPLAGRVITLEQAARFLTDHLMGDTYYRVEREGQNLDRARGQLALLASLETTPGLA